MLHLWWGGGGVERAGGGKEGGTKIHFPQQQSEMLICPGRSLAAFSAPMLAWAPALMLSGWCRGIAPFCFSCRAAWQHNLFPVHKLPETA